MSTPLRNLTKKLRLNPSAADYLDGVRKYGRETFIAWCLRGGSDLTIQEVALLRWEYIQGATVRGPIGLRGTSVEASIVLAATEALAEFRKPSGEVFKHQEWQKALRYLRRADPLLDVEVVRKKLSPAPAQRVERRFTPRGPNKSRNEIPPALAPTKENMPAEEIPTEDPAAMVARIRAEYANVFAGPSEPPAEPKARASAKRRSFDWPFKSNQSFASAVEVADFLGVSARSIKNWMKDGRLRGNRLGVVRIELSSVRELIADTALGAGSSGRA